MAGESYLDLLMIYDVSRRHIYKSFEKAATWINSSLTFPLVEALQNEDKAFFAKVSEDFAVDSSGHYTGCCDGLGGLAIRIRRPTEDDGIFDIGAYYCRKGFYAFICQAMCDVRKRIVWISSRHIGSCHDSRAFTDTKLYCFLVEKKLFLLDNGFFFVGDSAYDLESFLLIPFDEPKPQSEEDAYNFYHSNCRIRIECTFGELIMRFDLFWRTLKLDLKNAGDVINDAALLHNFIVDERENSMGNDDDTPIFHNFSASTVSYLDGPSIRGFTDPEREILNPVATDNNVPNRGGRPTSVSITSKEEGRRLRNLLKIHLSVYGMKRHMEKGFKVNDYGMVYMDY